MKQIKPYHKDKATPEDEVRGLQCSEDICACYITGRDAYYDGFSYGYAQALKDMQEANKEGDAE